jgi:hypothetical protein
VPPATLIIINMVGIVAGVSDAVNNNGHGSWGPLFGKLFFSFWVIVHLYPFLKGLMGRQKPDARPPSSCSGPPSSSHPSSRSSGSGSTPSSPRLIN